MKREKRYTVQEILKAAEIGETSMIDAKHICSLLDEARHKLKIGFECHLCSFSFTNPFDERFCKKGYDIEKEMVCNGTEYKSRY